MKKKLSFEDGDWQLDQLSRTEVVQCIRGCIKCISFYIFIYGNICTSLMLHKDCWCREGIYSVAR